MPTRKQAANAEMARIKKEIEKVEAEAKRVAARKAIEVVFEETPVFTGWFTANYGMKFTDREQGRLDFDVIPPHRPKPDERGAMESEALMNIARLFAKVRTIHYLQNNPERVVLGSGVHYAKHVGIVNGRPNYNNGIRIMNEAARAGAIEVTRRFQD